MGKFEVYADKAGEFRWRFLASNGKAIASSGEGYVAKRDCLHAIDVLKANAAGAAVNDTTAEAK